mgnify:CR=1 FL=1
MNSTSATSRPVLIMAGGTGGHVFPALAVARQLRDRDIPVVWLGTRRGLESRVVPQAGLPIAWVSVRGLRGKGVWRVIVAPFMIAWACLQVLVILIRLRPLAVLGMGGFVSGPGGVMAWLLRRPLLIHEQNSVAGLTNRLLAPLARRVMVAFPGALPARQHPVYTGNPVREEIAGMADPATRLTGRHEPMRLLVVGGSLGAAVLNEIVPGAVQQMEAGQRPELWHQTGDRQDGRVREVYRAAGIEGRVEPFITDMARAYAWADLVLCRAGALTVAELAAVGAGAILVPYPYAVDDHQTSNGRFLSEAGAAVLLPQGELSVERLASLLAGFSADRSRLEDMARRARELAQPDAAQKVAQLCLETAREAKPWYRRKRAS